MLQIAAHADRLALICDLPLFSLLDKIEPVVDVTLLKLPSETLDQMRGGLLTSI